MGDVIPDNINATLTLRSPDGDFGLNTLANQLGSGVRGDVGLGLNGTLGVNLGNVQADLGLANVGVKLSGGLDAKADVDAEVTGSIDIGLEDIRVRELAPIKLEPLKLELSWKSMRVRLPMNYEVKLKLFGFKLFEFSLCGETSVITEDLPVVEPASETVTTIRSYPPPARAAAASTERA